MATYTHDTVTTTTRRYLLPLPGNHTELSKLQTAMYGQWRLDFPDKVMTDDSVTVTAEDDVLMFSWATPATETVSKTPIADAHDPVCVCGHPRAKHGRFGCMVPTSKLVSNGMNYCECVVRGEQL